MNKYRHLTYDDRLTIEKLLMKGTNHINQSFASR